MVTIPSKNVFVIFPQILLFYTAKIYKIKWRIKSIAVILCLNVFLLQISFAFLYNYTMQVCKISKHF